LFADSCGQVDIAQAGDDRLLVDDHCHKDTLDKTNDDSFLTAVVLLATNIPYRLVKDGIIRS